MKKRLNQYKAEYILLIIFVIFSMITLYYHEPWYDEAEAWQIAKCASLRDIIFSLPHTEGHPPVWHLFLAVFAKNGFPYEITLKVITFIFSTINAVFILWKAPFKKAVKCCIPFTYFVFFQYGIIARPYVIMTLGMMLCASCYKDRNKKPAMFAASLAIICCASAFGILYAAGICIVWLFEIFENKLSIHRIRGFLTDKRFLPLLLLLLLNLFFFLLILPDSNALGLRQKSLDFQTIKHFLYMLFIIPSEAVCTSFNGFYYNMSYNYDLKYVSCTDTGHFHKLDCYVSCK